MINQLPPDVKENTKHFIQKVEEKGIEKTKRKAVENMLSEGFPVDVICRIQEVSEDFVEKIRREQS